MIKDAGNVSSSYADTFVKDFEKIFNKKLKSKKFKKNTELFLNDVEQKWGKGIRESWERLKGITPVVNKDKTWKHWSLQSFNFFKEYWLNSLLKSTKNLENNIIPNKIKEINQKYKNGESFYFEAEELLTQIISIKKKFEEDFQSNYQKYVLNNKEIKPEVRKILENYYNNDKVFKQVLKSKYNRSKSAYWGPFRNKLGRELELIPGFASFGKLLLGETPTWKTSFFPPLKNIVNKILWKDPRSFAEVAEGMTYWGRNKTLKSKLLFSTVFSFIVYPYLTALAKAALANQKSEYNKFMTNLKEWESLKKLAEVAYGEDSPQVKEFEKNKPELPKSKEIIDYWKESLPVVMSETKPYGIDNSSPFWTVLKDVAFWTYVDEVLVSLGQGVDWLINGKWGDLEFTKYLENANLKNMEKIKDLECYEEGLSFEENLVRVSKCAEESAKKGIVNDVQTSIGKIAGSSEGFKVFCKTYGFTIKSDFDGMTGTTVEYDNDTNNNIWQWKDNKFIPFARE